VEVVVQDTELRGPGFVTDFGDLSPLGGYIAAELDHRDLSEVLEFPPTSERIARHLAEWFIANLEPVIGGRLVSVKVSEGPASWASYSPACEAVS
jgi:6-pyruvoyltetrahydropterin/6-carboxytetrahydropterin synthase